MTNRDLNLDFIKGVGIFLVVLAHTWNHGLVIYEFHMPLFFILSGAAMSLSARKFSIVKKAKSLLVPYFVFSCLFFAYWFLLEQRLRPVPEQGVFEGSWLECIFGSLSLQAQQFVNIFIAATGPDNFIYDVVLWFLPALFVAECIFGFIKDTKWEWVVDALCIAFAHFLACKSIGTPWCADLAIVAVPFLSLGYHAYQPAVKMFRRIRWSGALVTLVSLVCFAVLFVALSPVTDMLQHLISPVFYTMGILGSVMVISVAYALNKPNLVGGGILGATR